MKKIYAVSICLLFTSLLFAQPVITSSWAPSGSFGSNITVTSNTVAHNAGASGANCTWNLNSWSSPDNFNSLDTCFFSVSTADYPGTTDLTTETSTSRTYYYFHKLAGNVYQNLGHDFRYYPTGDYEHFVWKTPLDLIHFPVHYNDQFITTGLYDLQWTYGSSYYSSHGSAFVLVTVDGYGRLNTPAGGFVNVLRIHTQENYTDSVDVAYQTWNITSSSTERYDWIAANRPGVILASTSTHNSVNGTTYYSYYSHVTPTATDGIDELSNPKLMMTVYPQPVNEQTTVEIFSSKSLPATLIISDIQGKVLIKNTTSLMTGNNSIPLVLKNFSNGIYLLSIRCEEIVSTCRIIVANP